MDPNACVARLVQALRGGDIDDATQAVADLQDWLGRGGFPPDDASVRVLVQEIGGEAGDIAGVLRMVEAMRLQGVGRGA